LSLFDARAANLVSQVDENWPEVFIKIL